METRPLVQEETPGQDLIEALKISRPDVAITIDAIPDDSYEWDGEGPDPAKEGFKPYTVEVAATTIRKGVLMEAYDSLAGCYFLPNEPLGEINGYLSQMVQEALAELDKEVARVLAEG